MSKNWEIDPETRSKLQAISKVNDNNRCVDCNAPSPQWASPKLGIFFCLACSGVHRSLGVHISFVRSVTMDAFKTGEVKRMELGGNRPWKDFFNEHSSNKLLGREFDSCTIAERYDSEAGEEWKDRLTAKVDGTEYVPGSSAKPAKKTAVSTNSSTTPAGSGRNTPTAGARSAPPQHAAPPYQKARNEAYFATMGQENASRPDDVPPSQGGKYAGFGSGPPPTQGSSGGVPTGDDFQRDPVAALTKGFGWLSSTVSKQAASVNKAYIQPGMKSLADGDFAAQARAVGMQAGSYVQQGARGVNDQFNRFVDPDSASGQKAVQPERQDFWDSFGQEPSGPPRDKQNFWDEFAAAGQARAQTQQQAKGPTSIGTSAMKTSSSGPGSGKKEDDTWGEW